MWDIKIHSTNGSSLQQQQQQQTEQGRGASGGLHWNGKNIKKKNRRTGYGSNHLCLHFYWQHVALLLKIHLLIQGPGKSQKSARERGPEPARKRWGYCTSWRLPDSSHPSSISLTFSSRHIFQRFLLLLRRPFWPRYFDPHTLPKKLKKNG